MKRRKNQRLVKAPPTNEQEVFVLSPDLLQKLGIQLSNLSAANGMNGESSDITQVAGIKVKNISIGSCDSSILETANLMKQSVHMSPTFVSGSDTEITSEINNPNDNLNIATGASHQIQEESVQNCIETFAVSNVKNIDSIDEIEYYGKSVSIDNNIMQIEGIAEVQSTEKHEVDTNSFNIIPKNEYSTCNKDNQNSSVVNSPVDHIVELCEYETRSQIINNNSETNIQPQKSRIQILSEQIINDSDLNTIKKSRVQKRSSCFHIPVNTILSGKITRDQSSLEQKLVEADDKITICNESNSITHHLQSVEKNKAMGNDLLSVVQSESMIITSDKVDKPNHKDITENGANGNETIQNTDYNIEDDRVVNLKNIVKNENKEVQGIENSNKKIISNHEEYSGKSKLSIQGVEKPGGTHENLTNQMLKTYQRLHTRKTKSQLSPVDYNKLTDSNILPDAGVIDLDKINIGGYKYINKFCNCYDYGKLAMYDELGDVYEHIHFCNKINVGCNMETLLTIYDENYVLPELHASEDINETDDIEDMRHNICWLFFNEDDHETAEQAVSKTNMSDNSNKSSGQPTRSNKKRRSIASGQTTPSERHSFDKTIKCGVCSLMLPPSEWDQHKDSKHNFIAWKDGQSIDLKNKYLLKMLGLKLKKLGALECTFCKVVLKKSKEFVQHVKTCIKQKVDNTTSTIGTEKPASDGVKVNKQISQNQSTVTERISKANIKDISKSKQSNIINISPKTKERECSVKSKNKSNEDNVQKEKTPKSSSEIKEVLKKSQTKVTPYTDNQEAPKSKRSSMNVSLKAARGSSKSTSSELSPNEKTAKDENRITRKSSIQSVDVASIQCNKVKILNIELKDKVSPISKRKSLDVPAETAENKCTTKVDKKTLKYKRTSIDESLKTVEIGQAQKSNRKSVELSAKDFTKSKNISIAGPKDTILVTSKSEKLPKERLEKPTTSNRKIIEIDIFPNTTTTKEVVNVLNKPVSAKKSKGHVEVEITAKMTLGSLNPRKSTEVEVFNSLKRKRVEAEKLSSMSSRKCMKTTEPTKVVTPTTLESCLIDTSNKSDNVKHKSSRISKNLSSNDSVPIRTPRELIEIHIPSLKQKTDVVGNIISDSSVKGSSSTLNTKDLNTKNLTHVVDETMLAVTIKKEPLTKCGVCEQPVEDSQWFEHIGKEHNYLAWRQNEAPLNLNAVGIVRSHLTTILKQIGALTCYKCDLVRKYVKPYLAHIQNCSTSGKDEQVQMDVSTASVDVDTSQDLNDTTDSNVSHRSRLQRAATKKNHMNASTSKNIDDDDDDVPLSSHSKVAKPQGPVVCGVCNETLQEKQWLEHIRTQHNYLAWRSGENPVNLNDEVEVKIFLQTISKNYGGLKCSKCGAVWSYVKKWLSHEATCKGDEFQADESSDSDVDFNQRKPKQSTGYAELEVLPDIVKCAKCSKEMPSKGWIDHIETEHSYLAWIEGHTPLDESNTDVLTAYLHAMSHKRGSLYCAKCGVSRKYPKVFLTHIAACEATGFKREEYFVEVTADLQPGEYECAVCHEVGNRNDFTKHAMEKHYNIAWMAGEMPINLRNPYAVEKYLKEYRAKHSLICKVCNASRSSCYGFYAHVLTCGKKEEELENLMNDCEVCKNKYLCIYRNQHLAWHKEQAMKKEKKEQDAVKEEERRLSKIKQDSEPAGKRRAAQKAKKVMEKYTSNNQDANNVCVSCHIEFDNPELLKDHDCQGTRDKEGNDSDVSVKMEESDDDDDDIDDDMDLDSNISDDEEEQAKKRKYQSDNATLPKMTLPFKVKDINMYLSKSYTDFCALHFTSECMFNNWRVSDYNCLSEEEAQAYLPLLTESCHLRFAQSDWESFKRFEARREKDMTTLFTGAAVRCMQWIPHNIADDQQDHYLSVSCYRGADCPRLGKDVTGHYPGMLQIWNIARFQIAPKLVMGIAHDYGTIWAMDWCHSGARDIHSSVLADDEEKGPSRLGLVAIACSNGRAYILSVPLVPSIGPDDNPIICNLKPVAELRLSMRTENPTHQATAISWSPQKEHEVVMVGYSDGTTALYNLNTASSFLKSIENGVHIFYPFHDAHAENSPITGVALSASEDLSRIVGGVASSSVTGATMSGWPDARPAVRSHLAASSVIYTPNWPAALLCSDDVLTLKSTNEMEWWGGGRRLGGACAGAACARCGRVCLAAPPFVRVLRSHPCYPELKKQIVATVKMIPLAQKRKLPAKDDLAMVIEPLTYDETIKKYGIEFKILPKKEQNVASRLSDNAEQCPNRFPLSDMPAAAFCPAAYHHNRLAIATHAGFVFLLTT